MVGNACREVTKLGPLSAACARAMMESASEQSSGKPGQFDLAN